MAYTKEQMASAAGVIDSGKGVNKKVNVSNESLSAGSYEGAMARREASGGRVGDGRYDKDAYVYRPETNTFYDTEAVQKAKDSFTNWMTAGKGANNKNWGYDMSDPEDVNRYYSGQISKKYEAGYGTDSFSQWLKENGLPQADYFDSKYYKDAYASVLADRVEKQKARDFRNAVVREMWNTASDPMNLTDEDLVAAYDRVRLNNPIYNGIELYNAKDKDTDYGDYDSQILAERAAQEKETKSRAGKLNIDEVWGDIDRLQRAQNTREQWAADKVKAEAETKTNQAQKIIDNAIANNNFSAEIDKRVGLAKDSNLNEYNANKQRKQAASDAAINAMREAGYSNQDIKKSIRNDGRLSYSESTEGKANEAERIKRRDSSDTTTAKVLGGMDSFTQGAVDKAKKLGNMGTSAQQGFSPISMMEGYGMSAQETQAVNNYVDTTRAILETQGYNGLEIDNALRRADLGEYIPTATARTNYATYTLQECGMSDEQIQYVLSTYTEDDWKNTDRDMKASDYVENSTVDQLANSIISMPIRAALSIATGAVGLADMATAGIQKRDELWKTTQALQEEAAWWTQYSHDRNHEIISTAADVGSEIMRMYATSLTGSVLAAGATKVLGNAAGTNFLFGFVTKNASRMPFVANSIGNYYLEAMNDGATTGQATAYAIPAGLLEGYLESLEMGETLQHAFGTNIVGKKIAASGLSANFKTFAITKGMPFINFALGTIGEGLEEAASYYGSSIARMATWDKGYEMDFSEMWDNAKGGLLIGGIMNGLSMGAHTQSYKYASEIYKGTGGNYAAYLDSFMSAMHMENMNDVQRQALIDKYNSGEINVSRDAAINAGVEIQTNAEVVAAKKQAVESAENDAAVKVENANNKVTQAEQRLAGIDDPDPVKKGKKIAQASRELTAAKAAASQTASEGQKKVDTATADYKSEAAKAKRKNAANQQLVDEYHASKYCSDIERDAVNAPVGGSAANPTANTNADANTAQNGIDNIKNGVERASAERITTETNIISNSQRGRHGIIQESIRSKLPELQSMEPVSRLTGHEFQKTAEDTTSLRSKIIAFFNSIGNKVTRSDIGDIALNTTGVRDSLGHGYGKLKAATFASLPDVLTQGRIISQNPPFEGHKYDSYIIAAPVNVEDEKCFVGALVIKDANTQRYKLHEVLALNNNDVVFKTGTTQEGERSRTTSLLNNSISNPGENINPQFKDLGANTPTPAELKQSKVYTNTYDKWLTEAEKSADSVENSVYAVSKEADSIAMAKERVRASIDRTGNIDEAMRSLAHGSWDAPDVDTAMLIGETLRAEAAETGDYARLNDWKKEIQRHMTESGQAIQALAKWTRDSSIGAETALDKAVADINKQNQKRIDKGKMAPIEVNPELLAELNNTQTRAERDAVMNKIAADIGSKMPAGILDKIRAWRYLSMLGNPRTVLRNLIGNEIMSDVLWTSKDAVGAGLEKVMGVDQSQRTKALAFSDEYKANKAYAATTLDDARTALEDSSRYDTKSGIERAIDENRQIFKFKPVEKWREATNWALSEGDTVFLERQYKRSFAQIMTARGYTPDTMTAKQRSECMSYAINEAKRSTFHDANSLADAMTNIENKNLATKILVGGTVPFKKTPLNVLARGVEFSPIGLIQGTGQMLTDVKAGKMDASTAIDKMSSGLVGSSLMALGYFLAKSGVISGGDNDEDKYYQSDLGKQEYALNLPGSSSMTIDWAAPASIPLFMGVALQELIDGSGSSDEAQTVGDHIDAFLGTLSSITDPLVEMSMLQGLQDTLEAVANARSDGNSLIGAALVTAGRGYASQFVPTIGGQIARTIDPVRRDTVGDPTSELGKDLDKVTNKMQAKIPGLASDLQPYINVWGEQEINEHSWPVRLLEQTILPGYLDKVDMTPVDVELTRLYSVTQDPSVVPSNYPYRTLKSGDERYVLTADEYTEFKIENGRAMYAAAEDAINSSQYSRMSDDEKASYVAKAIRDAQDDILKRYKKKYLGK
nr:MAG TPA: Large polyvalent protein-associated domain 3 [Bacteriophage sp.]